MTIDKQCLEASLQRLLAQRREALDAAKQCEGGIDILRQMVARLAQPEPKLASEPTTEVTPETKQCPSQNTNPTQ
jgi:hypothetical protein